MNSYIIFDINSIVLFCTILIGIMMIFTYFLTNKMIKSTDINGLDLAMLRDIDYCSMVNIYGFDYDKDFNVFYDKLKLMIRTNPNLFARTIVNNKLTYKNITNIEDYLEQIICVHKSINRKEYGDGESTFKMLCILKLG
jgi:hypothetical protein